MLETGTVSLERHGHRPTLCLCLSGERLYPTILLSDSAMSETVKVIELVGSSTESWEDAAHNALDDANETLENINGVKVASQTASIEDGDVERYKTTLHVTFELQR